MCGCSGIVQQLGPFPGAAPATSAPALPSGVSGSSLQLPVQTNINDGSIRNAALAERSLERLRFATRDLQTEAAAAAAGYHPNPSAPDHWINDQVFAERNGFDIDRPATLMFEGGRLIGVMLSHDPRTSPPPDLGAGSWHTHPGTTAEELALHVRLDKPLAQAFGTETGDV